MADWVCEKDLTKVSLIFPNVGGGQMSIGKWTKEIFCIMRRVTPSQESGPNSIKAMLSGFLMNVSNCNN